MISATEGLAALAAAVVRSANVTMLQEVSSGTVPVLALMSKLDHIVLQQLRFMEPRKESHEKSGGGPTQPAVPAVSEEQGEGVDAMAVEPSAAIQPPVDTLITQPISVDTNAAPTPPEPVDKSSDKKKKKSPEDVSYEVLLHFVVTVRGLYSAVAKTVHTPTRRREESGVIPSPPMIGAAAALALVLKSSLDKLPGSAGEAPLSGMEDMEDTVQGEQLQRWLRHAVRVVEQLSAVLFDSRRRSCHCLVLNFFIRFNGVALLSRQFQNSVQMLWQCQQLEERMKVAPPNDGPSTGQASSSEAIVEGTGAAAGDKKAEMSRRAPTVLAEATVQSFLGLFEQLTHSQLPF